MSWGLRVTIDEIKKIIHEQEKLGLTNAVLKITKPRNFRQTSQYLRTPFGKCLARFNRETKDSIEFVIFVPIEGMKKFVNKAESQVNNPNTLQI